MRVCCLAIVTLLLSCSWLDTSSEIDIEVCCECLISQSPPFTDAGLPPDELDDAGVLTGDDTGEFRCRSSDTCFCDTPPESCVERLTSGQKEIFVVGSCLKNDRPCARACDGVLLYATP